MVKKLLYSNTSWSLLSNGATALLGFINLAFIARRFSQNDAGKWFMLLTIYTLLEMLRSGWVQTPFVRYFVVAKSDSERSQLTAAAWQLLLGFTVVLSLVVTVAFYFINHDATTAYPLAAKLTVVWLFAALPYQLVQWQLQAKSLFKKLAVIRLVFPLSFALLLLLQRQWNLSIEVIALLYAMLQLLAGLVGSLTGWLHFGNWRKNVSTERKKLSGFGKYSMLTMVTASLLRSSDQFIIASFLGPAAVAVYAVPQKLIEAIEIPVRSFASVGVPNATSLWQNEKVQQLRKFFYNQCGMLTMMIIPLLLVLLLFPSYIVNLLGGSKYHQSALVLQIFCLYAVMIPLDRYCGLLLDASNRPHKNTVKVVLMLIVNITGDLIAVYSGAGIYGIAACSTVTFLFGVIIGWIQLKDILLNFSPNLLWKEGVLHSYQTLIKEPKTSAL